MHADLMSDLAADPTLTPLWDSAQDSETATQTQMANRLISFLALKYDLGLLDKNAVRATAQSLMEQPVTRAYWTRWRSLRIREATTCSAQQVVDLLDEAYIAAQQ
ncbi:hypothetical protein E0L36_02195 [Streptomyces sp. AJS327]|nr:hypothetical protein [Streptomyces sp. AJS327]